MSDEHKRHRIPPKLTHCARRLRRDSTFPERLLWKYLRDRKVSSAKFRRQQALRPFVADFFCAESKLIVELDGHSHNTTAVNDLKREGYLTKQGFRVIRFANDEVLQNADGVVQAIANAIEAIKRGEL